MKHKSVVRNQAYQASGFQIRERHNERKNTDYFNGDIELERAHLNVHFRQNFSPDDSLESYEETFKRLLDERKIVKHGIKPDAKVFCEMIFDVNTAYFEENGGYEYAKKFFEEAYRLAVKEAGSEDYILSAVMHADERNKALSEQYGRDVYHYHLHVVYVPVVEKKLYFRKNNKDPNLAGKLKEIIPQISQSNKWPLRVPVERDGKTIMLNSYSLLQDRFYEHMKAVGFDGFARGERGSTTEHLNVLDYKIQQDKKRLNFLSEQTEQKQAQVDHLAHALKVRKDTSATHEDIESMAKSGKSGNNKIVANADWQRVSEMAKRCLILDAKTKDLQKQVEDLRCDRDKWKKNYERLWDEVKDFIKAIRSMPGKLLTFITEHRHNKTKNQEVK